MESLKFHLLLVLVLIAQTILQSHPVFSNHLKGLVQGINLFRQNYSGLALTEDEQAKCLADKLSDQLRDRRCNVSTTANHEAIPANSLGRLHIKDYQTEVLSKCKIDIHHTNDSVILPVCAPNVDPQLVQRDYTQYLVLNYTNTTFATYVNDSKFANIGVDCQDDWIVVVLSTNTTSGDLASAAVDLVLEMRLGVVYLVALLLGVGLLIITS